jgi:hypothetical protein
MFAFGRQKTRRLAISAALAATLSLPSLIGPLANTAHAQSRRCEVLQHYMDNHSPDGWIWRAASVEYGNYCV